MAMIGCDNDSRLVPRIIRFDPTRDHSKCIVATKNGSNGVVDVVLVIGPIDVARFNH